MVSGTSKALEIPPELHARAKPTDTPADVAVPTPDAQTAMSRNQIWTDNSLTLGTSTGDTSTARGQEIPAPQGTIRQESVPAFLTSPPSNPAMAGNTSAAETPAKPRLRGVAGRVDEDEIDTYAEPVRVPDEFNLLGGGNTNTAEASRMPQTPQTLPNQSARVSLSRSANEGLRAISVAQDGFEYVKQLRAPSEAAQADIDTALAALMENAIEKFEGKIDAATFSARRASGQKALNRAFDTIALDFENLDRRLLQSPIHSSNLAKDVRDAARREQHAWKNAIFEQVALFDQHANGKPRSALRLPSIRLFFPFLEAKSRHMAAAYRLEAAGILGVSSAGLTDVPGATKALLTSLTDYNDAYAQLLQTVNLSMCSGDRYKAQKPQAIIPALNDVDIALGNIPGLDREGLAEFTPILINAGVKENDFVSLRGPLSKALNELELRTLSKMASGYQPVFTLVEENADLSLCQGEDGIAVSLADGLTQIGAVSLEEIIDPYRESVFAAATNFYRGLVQVDLPSTIPPNPASNVGGSPYQGSIKPDDGSLRGRSP